MARVRKELHLLIRLQRRKSGAWLDMSQCFDSFPGLALRKRQVYRRMRQLAASIECQWVANELGIALANPKCGPPLKGALCKELNAILDQPITPRWVCQIARNHQSGAIEMDRGWPPPALGNDDREALAKNLAPDILIAGACPACIEAGSYPLVAQRYREVNYTRPVLGSDSS